MITPELGERLSEFLSQGVNLPRCADCHSVIIGNAKKTVQESIDGTVKVYGRQLCLPCVYKAMQEAKANAAKTVSE